jgi:hypothetical protein
MKNQYPLTIDNTNGLVALDKRTHFPTTVSTKCPGCQRVLSRDFSEEHYLAYPESNKTFPLRMYCEACDESWDYPVVLRVKLERVREQSPDAPKTLREQINAIRKDVLGSEDSTPFAMAIIVLAAKAFIEEWEASDYTRAIRRAAYLAERGGISDEEPAVT